MDPATSQKSQPDPGHQSLEKKVDHLIATIGCIDDIKKDTVFASINSLHWQLDKIWKKLDQRKPDKPDVPGSDTELKKQLSKLCADCKTALSDESANRDYENRLTLRTSPINPPEKRHKAFQLLTKLNGERDLIKHNEQKLEQMTKEELQKAITTLNDTHARNIEEFDDFLN